MSPREHFQALADRGKAATAKRLEEHRQAGRNLFAESAYAAPQPVRAPSRKKRRRSEGPPQATGASLARSVPNGDLEL